MKIEFQFNSVSISPDQIQEQYPGLISMMNLSLPVKKTLKKRKYKKKKTIGSLIEEIIADVEK